MAPSGVIAHWRGRRALQLIRAECSSNRCPKSVRRSPVLPCRGERPIGVLSHSNLFQAQFLCCTHAVEKSFLLPESFRTRRARRPTVLRDRGLLPESSRTRGARWPIVLRRRGLMPPRSSNWKSRAQVVRGLPPSPQGTTALSTPPFVRAEYGCRNNTTSLRRPEAAGWAPSVWQAR